MDLDKTLVIENKLDRIGQIAMRMQSAGLFIALFIVALRTSHPYTKTLGKGFAIFALLISAILGRIYLHKGKKLEEIKTFSSEEGDARKKEYFIKFITPYFFWSAWYGIFSWLK